MGLGDERELEKKEKNAGRRADTWDNQRWEFQKLNKIHENLEKKKEEREDVVEQFPTLIMLIFYIKRIHI